eukprot:8376232-Karenia_brevis.AAC.1
MAKHIREQNGHVAAASPVGCGHGIHAKLLDHRAPARSKGAYVLHPREAAICLTASLVMWPEA